jgi:TorA maturation chaperone TorD
MRRQRANIYWILSKIYIKEPTRELLDLLKEVGLNPKEKLEDLEVEYARLFIGPGKHIAPCESVHRSDDKGFLWGESTVAAKKFIEAAGLKYKTDFSGMPDHISVEFEFMQKLIDEEIISSKNGDAEAAKRARQIQKKFFEEHIGKWVPLFCEKIKEESSLRYFQDVADLTKNFILQEKEEIKNVETKDLNN